MKQPKRIQEEIKRTKEMMGLINEQDSFNAWDKFLYLFGAGDMQTLEDKLKAANKANKAFVKKYEVARNEDGTVILKPGITAATNYNFLKGHCMKYCEAATAAHTEFMSTHITKFGKKEADLMKLLIQGLEICEFDEMHTGALGLGCGSIKADLELMLKLLGWERKKVEEVTHNGKTDDTRVVGTNKHGKKWLCKDFEVRNGEWWVKSMNCKVADCFAGHYLDKLTSGGCN